MSNLSFYTRRAFRGPVCRRPLYRHPLFRKAALLLVLLISSFSSIGQVAVVVHTSNNSHFDQNAVSRIFLGKARTFENGATAIPISQDEKSKVTTTFNKAVLNKSSSQLKAYWSKLVFTGKGTPPRSVDNDQQVIELVSTNPNIIGFISVENINSSIKVVATFDN